MLLSVIRETTYAKFAIAMTKQNKTFETASYLVTMFVISDFQYLIIDNQQFDFKESQTNVVPKANAMVYVCEAQFANYQQ